jgi:hypothetical protein
MKKIYLFTFCICISLLMQAQMGPRDRAAILHIVGAEFTILPNKSTYPYTSFHSSCTVQPSVTRKYDTTGIYFHNEYLLFRHPIAYKQGSEVLKLMNPAYVTVNEYLEFQDYVRDSIAREKIFDGLQDDDKANRYIRYETSYPDKISAQIVASQPSYRAFNKSIFPLNWNQPFSYTSAEFMPLLADMYYPQPERLNLARTFDERKLVYKYTDYYERFQVLERSAVVKRFPQLSESGYQDKTAVQQEMSTLSDTYYWSALSHFDRDEYSILGHLYNQKLKSEPVIGISGMQASAFCHWKQERIQQQLDKQKLPYEAVVTAPLFEEVPSEAAPEMTIPARDYTAQWKITAAEYRKFMAYTQDSILRVTLFRKVPADADAVQMLDWPTPCFDEGSLAIVDALTFDEYRGREAYNQYVFPLNYRYKIRSGSFGGLMDSILHADTYQHPVFTYFYFDARERSIQGKFSTIPRYKADPESRRDTLRLLFGELDPDGEPIGKDQVFEYFNVLGQSGGVRYYENMSRLIHTKSVAILPASAIENADPKSLVQGLSYDQAVAFYYWKYPLQAPKTAAAWQQFVLPSEEQFRQVQRDEQVVIPARKVAYPTPVFRYVVHLYPK